MHVPFHSQQRCKDEIARELLAEADGKTNDCSDDQRAKDTAHARPADARDASVGLERQDPEPSFCNDDPETDIEILTGDAEN